MTLKEKLRDWSIPIILILMFAAVIVTLVYPFVTTAFNDEPVESSAYNITVLDKGWSMYLSRGVIETEYGSMYVLNMEIFSKMVLGKSYLVFTETPPEWKAPVIRKFELIGENVNP